MEILTILCFVSSMTYVGWLFGIAQKIEASEKSTTEAFKEGYIKGYLDGHTKKEKPYYEDFPEMGIN
jgi:hypothetical protein